VSLAKNSAPVYELDDILSVARKKEFSQKFELSNPKGTLYKILYRYPMQNPRQYPFLWLENSKHVDKSLEKTNNTLSKN